MPNQVVTAIRPTNPSNSNTPSLNPKKPSRHSTSPNPMQRNMIGNSRTKTRDFTWSGRINAVTPSTKPMFAMFDPIAFPTANAGLPLSEATAATNISGADVANPTIVNPTKSGGIPKLCAETAAPSTKRSAPTVSNAKPAIIEMYACIMNENREAERHMLGDIAM